MVKAIIHGKPSSYNNLGCRCTLCKKAWADYMRERVRKWRKIDRERKKEQRKRISINL